MGISSKNPLIGFLLKPKKPINFDAEHPNRTYLKQTKDTLAGDLVKDGDTIHVDDFIPVEAIVESVYRKPNGKTYVIGKKKDGSVETWMSTIVQKGSLPESGVVPAKKTGTKMFDAHRGRIRLWQVDDPIFPEGRIVWFSGNKAFVQDSHRLRGILLDELWSVMPASKYDRLHGSHGKTWAGTARLPKSGRLGTS